MYKKYFLIAIIVFGIKGMIAAQSPTLSLSGDSPATTLYNNRGMPTWITGTIVITKNDASVRDITVDVAPKADKNSPRNRNWVLINPVKDDSQYVDNAEIFFNQSTSGNVIKMWGSDKDVHENNVFRYCFDENSSVGSTISFNYYAVFWNESPLSAGTYQLTITFRVREERFNNWDHPDTSPVSTLPINLTFVVSPSASITFLSDISGTSQITELAFGEVTATTAKDFRVIVQSNFRYSLSVTSALGHGGFLYHERYYDAAAPVKETIPYTLSISGIPVPLAGAYTIASMERPTGSEKRTYPATITIGDIRNYTAGNYSDYLSFAVTAQ